MSALRHLPASLEASQEFEIQIILSRPQPPLPWMDPLLCVSDMEATVRHHPRFAASEHVPQVLEQDMAPQSAPPQACWPSGLVDDEHELMLSVGATGQAHEAQPQQPSVRAYDDAHVGLPDQPTDDGSSTPVHETDSPPSVEDFIAGLKLPLEVPLIQLSSRLRVSHVLVEDLVLHRSDRLDAKFAFCDPNSENQAKWVLVGKWQASVSAPRSAPATPNATIAARFHKTFREPLSSSKREAVQELFPMVGARRKRATAHAP
jgi:hypothetical protein